MMMMTDGAWPAQWLRGPLPLCVLRILEGRPAHGYAVAVELERLGMGSLTGGTLYPILGRLHRDGFLDAEWTAGAGGPGRKVYALTGAGARELDEQSARWRRFAAVTSGITSPALHQAGDPS